MRKNFKKFINDLWELRNKHGCLPVEKLHLLEQQELRSDSERLQRMKLLVEEIKGSLQPETQTYSLMCVLSADIDALNHANTDEEGADGEDVPNATPGKVEPNLVELCYTSKALKSFNNEVLAELIRNAHAYNVRHEISGLLYFDETSRTFTQILEGKDRQVRKLMAKISSDKRHKEIILRSKYQIKKRSFDAFPLMLKTCADIRHAVNKHDSFETWTERNFNISNTREISKSTKWVLEDIRENCLKMG